MPKIELSSGQLKAISKMKNGCILCGDTGSGKTRTALAYYYILNGGDVGTEGKTSLMKKPKDLYVITTATNRDKMIWEDEFRPFHISSDPEISPYKNYKVIVDSWNNIEKYSDIKNAFFIFDEQRVVGWGKWAKTFALKIAKNNLWILLSATPGDTWTDYCAVFIANGFFNTRSEFIHNHVIYKQFVGFRKIDKYINERRLVRLRDSILVNMEVYRDTIQRHINIFVDYDKRKYREIMKNRWNVFDDKPIENASELCYCLRKVVNSDESRLVRILEIAESHPRLIIFYNFDYELDLLKKQYYGEDVIVAEWNGHKHQPLPESRRWVYLVQYTAGAEGWNCIKTDTIIFYSQNYSYKIMKQACGRIDRVNTRYIDLYYYHLKSYSKIDLAISKALDSKKKFNEARFSKQ